MRRRGGRSQPAAPTIVGDRERRQNGVPSVIMRGNMETIGKGIAAYDRHDKSVELMRRLDEAVRHSAQIALRRSRNALWVRMPITDEVKSSPPLSVDLSLFCAPARMIAGPCPPVGGPRSGCQDDMDPILLQFGKELPASLCSSPVRLPVRGKMLQNRVTQLKNLRRSADPVGDHRLVSCRHVVHCDDRGHGKSVIPPDSRLSAVSHQTSV